MLMSEMTEIGTESPTTPTTLPGGREAAHAAAFEPPARRDQTATLDRRGPPARRKLWLVSVCNEQLPTNDYRVRYSDFSDLARSTFILPRCPRGTPEEDFLKIPFGEGIEWADLGNLWQLYSYLRAHARECDVVHFFSTKLTLFGPLVAAMAGVPSIVTVTGYGRTFNRQGLLYTLLRPLYLGLFRLATRATRAVLFQNYGDMEWLQEKLPGYAAKFGWIGSAVDCPLVEDKDFNGPLRILLVARLMQDKGIDLFLNAARQLAGERFRFTIVGPPSVGEQAVEREVREAAAAGIIDYRGELTSSELAEVYRQEHVFLFPSRYGEGMARVMLEAAHAGLCPIASSIPANRDLVQSERGFLLTDSSPSGTDEVVRLLRELELDRAQLQRKALAFQQYVVDQFSMPAYAARLDNILRTVLREKQSPANEVSD